MASSLLLAEISATCNAIGLLEGDTYYPSEECVETLKDLIRYLRRDGETHEIRRKLGETNVVVFDLIPLLKSHWQNNDILTNCVRLLVNLTNPVMFIFGDDLPTEKVARNHCETIEQHLIQYKQAFTDQTVWDIFTNILNEMFRKTPMERGEDENQMIQRILILTCNLLRVPPSTSDDRRSDTDTSLHDDLLWNLHTSGMNDIFMYLATTEQESNLFMHLLEIFHFMFAGIDPKVICNAVKERSKDEKLRDQSELAALKEAEKQNLARKLKEGCSSRHSRFGGAFVVKDFKAVGEKDMIINKPINAVENVDFNKNKARRKVSKIRKAMDKEKRPKISAFSIRLFMREFCIGILNSGGYYMLMHHAKRMIDSMTAQSNDESYYLWACWFFMIFNVHYNGKVKYVSETVNIQTFHFVSTQMEKIFDAMNTDKKHLRVWSKRMHYAVRVYMALLSTLNKMDSDRDSATRQSSSVIKRNLFYGIEYREMLLTLFLYYDERKFTPTFLADLVKTTHTFLRLLSHFCDCNRSSLVIQEVKKRKAGKPKKKKAKKPKLATTLEQSWETLAPELSLILQQNEVLPEVVPFDATLETPIDDQRAVAMSNIRQHMLDDQPELAISLMRACRDVWPENECFGSTSMSPTDEFMALRDIYMTVLPAGETATGPASEPEDDELDEEEAPPETPITETRFNFMEFLNRFAHPTVVRALITLLSNFQTNDQEVNDATLRLMFRIGREIGLPALFYQISFFEVYQRIFHANRPCDQKLIEFGKYLMGCFRKSSMKNPKVFAEALFPVQRRDALDVADGSYDVDNNQTRVAWTEEEEDELHRLCQEYQSMEGGGNAMALGDWVLSNIIRQDRSKRGLNKKLRELGYDVTMKNGSHSRAPKHWGEEEVAELNVLWEQFRDSDWPLGNIVNHLAVKRPPQRVSEKLLELGLASDKKELYKKRCSRRPQSDADDESGGDSSSHGADGEESQTPKPSTTPPKPKRKLLTRGERKRSVDPSSSSDSEEDDQPPRPPRPNSAGGQNSHKCIEKLVRECLEKGYRDTVEWLKDQFIMAVEDYDPEIHFPLLPETATISEEIKLPCFQRLFKQVGVIYIPEVVYPRLSRHQSVHETDIIITIMRRILAREDAVSPVEVTNTMAASDLSNVGTEPSCSEKQSEDGDTIQTKEDNEMIAISSSNEDQLAVNKDASVESDNSDVSIEPFYSNKPQLPESSQKNLPMKKGTYKRCREVLSTDQDILIINADSSLNGDSSTLVNHLPVSKVKSRSSSEVSFLNDEKLLVDDGDSSDRDKTLTNDSPVKKKSRRCLELSSESEEEWDTDVDSGANGRVLSSSDREVNAERWKENIPDNSCTVVRSSKRRRQISSSSSDGEHDKGKRLPNKVFIKKGIKKPTGTPVKQQKSGENSESFNSFHKKKKARVISDSDDETRDCRASTEKETEFVVTRASSSQGCQQEHPVTSEYSTEEAVYFISASASDSEDFPFSSSHFGAKTLDKDRLQVDDQDDREVPSPEYEYYHEDEDSSEEKIPISSSGSQADLDVSPVDISEGEHSIGYDFPSNELLLSPPNSGDEVQSEGSSQYLSESDSEQVVYPALCPSASSAKPSTQSPQYSPVDCDNTDEDSAWPRKLSPVYRITPTGVKLLPGELFISLDEKMDCTTDCNTDDVEEENVSSPVDCDTDYVEEENVSSPVDCDTDNVEEENVSSPVDCDTDYVEEENVSSPVDCDTDNVEEENVSSPVDCDTDNVEEENVSSPVDCHTDNVEEENVSSPVDCDTDYVEEENVSSHVDCTTQSTQTDNTDFVEEENVSSPVDCDTDYVEEENVSSPVDCDTDNVEEENVSSPVDCDTDNVEEENVSSPVDCHTDNVEEENVSSPVDCDTDYVEEENVSSPVDCHTDNVEEENVSSPVDCHTDNVEEENVSSPVDCDTDYVEEENVSSHVDCTTQTTQTDNTDYVEEENVSSPVDCDTDNVEEENVSSPVDCDTDYVEEENVSSHVDCDTDYVEEENVSSHVDCDTDYVEEENVSSPVDCDTDNVEEENVSSPEDCDTDYVEEEENVSSPVDCDTDNVEEENVSSPVDCDTDNVEEENVSSPVDCDTDNVEEENVSSPVDCDTDYVEEENVSSPVDCDTDNVEEENVSSPVDCDTDYVEEENVSSHVDCDTDYVEEENVSSPVDCDTDNVEEENVSSPVDCDTDNVEEENVSSPVDCDTDYVEEQENVTPHCFHVDGNKTGTDEVFISPDEDNEVSIVEHGNRKPANSPEVFTISDEDKVSPERIGSFVNSPEVITVSDRSSGSSQ